MKRFSDRKDAGRQLADRLSVAGLHDPLLLALPRGGVPVAAEVADALAAPLEVLVARKIGAPGHAEFGIGAVAEAPDARPEEVVITDAARRLGVGAEDLQRLVEQARLELRRRVGAYRAGRPLPTVTGRTVVLVDDGLATGVTAEAALRALRLGRPDRLVLAVPVGAPDSVDRLSAIADEVVCVLMPDELVAVGQWYADFTQTTDAEVLALLARHRRGAVTIPVPDVGSLAADLTTVRPGGPMVVFAHGSGSSRHSPRNQQVAGALNACGFGTLLLDLLTEAEESLERRGGRIRFDVDMLANRLVAAVEWLDAQPDLAGVPVGYFGASTGAAGALAAAARQGDRIAAVVSRGGRPDLAGDLLPLVQAPTLLLVGGRDPQVLELNEAAHSRLTCPSRIEVVPGATHLFEEAGALELVAVQAADWFDQNLVPAPG